MTAVDIQRFDPRVEAAHAIYGRRNVVSQTTRQWVADVLGEPVEYEEGRGCTQLIRLRQLIRDEKTLAAVTNRLTQ